ncbi:MAG: signal peptidase I [Acidobacteriia bacterium]|nr:signal peptidase I [Terriglobia bacterium]
MTNSSLVRWLCHIYSVLLFAYPRQFRLQYGGEMRQVFRDRCSYLARTGGRLRLLRFGVHSGADWLATTVRESIDALRTAAPAGETVAGSYWRNMVHTVGRHARSIWSAGRKPSPRGFVAEWAMTILLYLFATTTLVQAYVVPTGSMEGNLRIGDHMLVDRLVYADPGAVGRRLLPYHDVQRGDIVAFLYPEDIRQTYVKRVIGLPGDCIRLVDRQVVRNGRLLIEHYTRHIGTWRDAYRDDFPTAPEASTTPRGRDMFQHHVRSGEVLVPPGALFVMGDNRENSADSRYWGFVPREYVVGKPLVVYWSFDAPTSELEEWSLAHVLDVTLHFLTKTRWERTFLVPRAQPAQEAGGAR